MGLSDSSWHKQDWMNNKNKFFFRWYNIVEKLIDLKTWRENESIFSIFGEKWVKLNFNKKKKTKYIF